MYIIENSLKNLVRNKGRNVMVLIVAVLTLTSVTLSFTIQMISKNVIQRYKDSFHVDATIDYDWEKLEKDFPPTKVVQDDGSVAYESSYDLPVLSMDDYLNYADSPYVKQTQYNVNVQFACETLSQVPHNLHANESFINLNGMSIEELMKFFGFTTREELVAELGGEEALQQTLDTRGDCVGDLIGYTDRSLLDEFTNGENKLESGRFPEKDGECIVSSKYAEHNHLKIGDTFEVSGPSKSDTNKITLNIVGIYAALQDEANAIAIGNFYGHVYTTFDTVMNSGFHWIYPYKVVYQLKDPDSVGPFEQELYAKGLSEYRVISCANSDEEYVKNTEPLKNISMISEIFTLCAGVVGSAIILLLSCLQIRERKYEIGVLRAMGMKKTDIAKGMVYEILLLMLAGFGVSLLLSVVLAQPIAAALISNLTGVGSFVSGVAVLLCLGMAVLLSVVSGVCSVFTVMRHEPMKILSERN